MGLPFLPPKMILPSELCSRRGVAGLISHTALPKCSRSLLIVSQGMPSALRDHGRRGEDQSFHPPFTGVEPGKAGTTEDRLQACLLPPEEEAGSIQTGERICSFQARSFFLGAGLD